MQLSSGVNSAVPGPPPPQHAHHLFGPDQILFGPPRKHEPGALYHPMQSTLASHQASLGLKLYEFNDHTHNYYNSLSCYVMVCYMVICIAPLTGDYSEALSA